MFPQLHHVTDSQTFNHGQAIAIHQVTARRLRRDLAFFRIDFATDGIIFMENSLNQLGTRWPRD